MGTYTYFRLVLTPQDSKKDTATIIQKFREACPDAKTAIDENGCPFDESMWYSHEKDLMRFSKKNRGFFFELSGYPAVPDGEDDKPWAIVYLNGLLADSFTVDADYVRNGPDRENKEETTSPTKNEAPIETYPKPTRESIPKNGTVIYMWDAALGVPKSVNEAASIAQHLHTKESCNNIVSLYLNGIQKKLAKTKDEQHDYLLALSKERRSSVSYDDVKLLAEYLSTTIENTVERGATRLTLECENWDILVDHIISSVNYYSAYTINEKNKRTHACIVLYVVTPKMVLFSSNNEYPRICESILSNNVDIRFTNNGMIGQKELMKWKYRLDEIHPGTLPASRAAVKKHIDAAFLKMASKYGHYYQKKDSYSNNMTCETCHSGDTLNIEIQVDSTERPRHYNVWVSIDWNNPIYSRAIRSLRKVHSLRETNLIISSIYFDRESWSYELSTYNDADLLIDRLENKLKPIMVDFGGIIKLNETLNGDLCPWIKDVVWRQFGPEKFLLTAHLAKSPEFETIVNKIEDLYYDQDNNSNLDYWRNYVSKIRSYK